MLKQKAKSKASAPFPDIASIYEIFASSRNEDLNGYAHSLLDVCIHFSASFPQFYLICELISMHSDHQGVPITFVPSTCAKYVSPDKRSIVINWIEESPSHDLVTVKNQFQRVLDLGLLGFLKCSEKCRSGSDHKKNLPFCTLVSLQPIAVNTARTEELRLDTLRRV